MRFITYDLLHKALRLAISRFYEAHPYPKPGIYQVGGDFTIRVSEPDAKGEGPVWLSGNLSHFPDRTILSFRVAITPAGFGEIQYRTYPNSDLVASPVSPR